MYPNMNITNIGDRLVVVPEARRPYAGSRIPIILGPGRAFGSGEHETTSSCLEELEGIPELGRMRVLDLGSGTGILSIAAAKLGAPEVAAGFNKDSTHRALADIRDSIEELSWYRDHLFDKSVLAASSS